MAYNDLHVAKIAYPFYFLFGGRLLRTDAAQAANNNKPK